MAVCDCGWIPCARELLQKLIDSANQTDSSVPTAFPTFPDHVDDDDEDDGEFDQYVPRLDELDVSDDDLLSENRRKRIVGETFS